MKRIAIILILLVSLTGCDPMDFRNKIINNTDSIYLYYSTDSAYLQSLKFGRETLSGYPPIYRGDTLIHAVMKPRWQIGNEPAHFFFVKADDLKNHPFDSILKNHLYIQKRFTMEEMQKMNYIVKIGQ